ARAFLSAAPPADVADIEGSGADESSNGRNLERPALRWRGEESEVIRAGALRPGDTIIVPASYGGCDEYGWHPQYTDAVADIGDMVVALRRGAPILRVHQKLGGGSGLRAVLQAIDADE